MRAPQAVSSPDVLFLLGVGAAPSTTLLSVVGEIHGDSAADLRAVCEMAVNAPGIREMVLDLSRAPFVNPHTEFTTLVNAQDAAEAAGVVLRVNGSSQSTRRSVSF